MTIGTKIRALRKERGFTLSKLAGKINVSTAFLSNVERGLKKPSVNTLKLISQVLNTSVSYLLEAPTQNAAGNKLKFLRETRGISIEDLSEICEMTPETISGFEEGTTQPDLASLERLAMGLNYSIRYFLENSGSTTSLGHRLRELRKRHNLSIGALADMAKVSPGLISLIENDKTIPLLNTLENIANCLNTDSSYFLLDQEETETLYFSLGPDVRDMLSDPKFQAVMRTIRDFNKDELQFILDYIHNFKRSSQSMS